MMGFKMAIKKQYVLLLSLPVVVVIILLLNRAIEFPFTIKTYMEVKPQQKWVLAKGDNGQLTSSLFNYEFGFSNNLSVTQFERGELISFEFHPSIKNKRIYVGDTIVIVRSNELEQRLIELEGELSVAKAELASKKVGEKISLIDEAENKLQFAQARVDEKKISINRIEQLFKKGLLSQEEYEIALWELKQLEIDRNIYKSQLEAVSSGSKPEEIKRLESNVNALNNEINLLSIRLNELTIISPIDGVKNPSFSSDTLLTLIDIDNVVLTAPIKISELGYFEEDSILKIKLNNFDEEFDGRIILLSKEVKYLDGTQVVIANILIDNRQTGLLPGMILEGEIILDTLSIPELAIRYFFN